MDASENLIIVGEFTFEAAVVRDMVTGRKRTVCPIKGCGKRKTSLEQVCKTHKKELKGGIKDLKKALDSAIRKCLCAFLVEEWEKFEPEQFLSKAGAEIAAEILSWLEETRYLDHGVTEEMLVRECETRFAGIQPERPESELALEDVEQRLRSAIIRRLNQSAQVYSEKDCRGIVQDIVAEFKNGPGELKISRDELFKKCTSLFLDLQKQKIRERFSLRYKPYQSDEE